MSWVRRVFGGNPPSGGGDVPREDQAHIRLDLERHVVRDGLGDVLRLIISDNSGE